jgi:Raf kinase inhibitor-like YbhB/YbcL family protein
MELSSPAFADGDPIPREYGYTAENVNPPLRIDDVPDDATSLALVVDDPDAREPAGKIWDHWVIWNLDPDVGEIPRDWDATGAVEGDNDFDERGWGGPNPPDGEHTYVFTVYALADTLDLPSGSTKADLESGIDGKILAETTLEGTYAP